MKTLNHEQLITLIEQDKTGECAIETLSIKKYEDIFKVNVELESCQLNLNNLDEINSRREEKKLEISEDKGKKSFSQYRGTLLISPITLYVNSRYLIAKVIDAENNFNGSKKIKLYPSPKFLNWKAVSFACAVQFEIKVNVYNTRGDGTNTFYVESASLVQQDLFKTEVMSFFDEMLEGRQ